MKIKLQYFAEGGETGATISAGAQPTVSANTEIASETSVNQGDGTPAAKLTFDEILNDPDYRKAYDDRMQSAVKDRLKKSKGFEEQNKALTEQLDGINNKFTNLYALYGVDNVDSLIERLNSESSLYQDEADRRGITVDQLKSDLAKEMQYKKLEQENAEYKKQEQARLVEAQREAQFKAWDRQIEEAKVKYPNFDITKEMDASTPTGQQFAKMLNVGVSVQAAYEAVHFNELMEASKMQAFEQAKKTVTDSIASRGARPIENLSSTSPSVNSTVNVESLSGSQIRDYIRRSQAGEYIDFKSN